MPYVKAEAMPSVERQAILRGWSLSQLCVAECGSSSGKLVCNGEMRCFVTSQASRLVSAQAYVFMCDSF
jgi:hypothetical protein